LDLLLIILDRKSHLLLIRLQFQHHRFYLVPNLVLLKKLIRVILPIFRKVGFMDEPFNAPGNPDKHAEVGNR
jgi:hypothetical protein